ncbi:adhesion G-protein coupled receptor G6-like isoform X2 [Octopus vulgaris]|uniref:Adhesion G-protein coupled receptor G6-like isoform X2 n=1 Tax=Octopus vulgaris TaxID=6645 RepID=A0AA36B849_OCTVU|nr:adhesion G-protein coupled receptor G6-like isoform X2 [Octopus vulgaris]
MNTEINRHSMKKLRPQEKYHAKTFTDTSMTSSVYWVLLMDPECGNEKGLASNIRTKALDSIQNSNSHLQVKDTANFISLGKSLLTHLKEGEESKWSRMTFFSLREDKLYRVIQKSRTKANENIYSNVIAASIPNIRITNLDKPVIISYNLINQIATKPQCVYWDQSPGQDPRWSTKGCITSEYVPGEKVLCSCNHLTSFALQMIEEKNIHFISNVGCGISFVFLVLTVIFHVSFKNLRKLMTSKILVCLCISLAVSNLIFLVGMQEYATTKPAACKAVAALIHYFLMTSLMWMSVEVLHVCLHAAVISETVQRSFMIRSSILAWGLPMIIVSFTLAINYTNNYIRIEQTCWLSAVPFYTALVAPMGIILIFNVFIFSIDFWYLMMLQTNTTLKLETKRTRILGIVGVFVLFSAAWILAFFSFGETDEVFTFLFAIFNLLQGMFVFFYYCIYTKNTRDVIFSCVHKRKEENTRENDTYNKSSTTRERTDVLIAETIT